MRRSIFVLILLLIVYGLSFGTMNVGAQPYPNRPIQLISISPPGGGGDITSNRRIAAPSDVFG